MFKSYTEILRGSSFPCAPPEHWQPRGCSPISLLGRAAVFRNELFFFHLCYLVRDNPSCRCWPEWAAGRDGQGKGRGSGMCPSHLGHPSSPVSELLNAGGLSGRKPWWFRPGAFQQGEDERRSSHNRLAGLEPRGRSRCAGPGSFLETPDTTRATLETAPSRAAWRGLRDQRMNCRVYR